MAICPGRHLAPASLADLGLSFPATQAASLNPSSDHDGSLAQGALAVSGRQQV